MPVASSVLIGIVLGVAATPGDGYVQKMVEQPANPAVVEILGPEDDLGSWVRLRRVFTAIEQNVAVRGAQFFGRIAPQTTSEWWGETLVELREDLAAIREDLAALPVSARYAEVRTSTLAAIDQLEAIYETHQVKPVKDEGITAAVDAFYGWYETILDPLVLMRSSSHLPTEPDPYAQWSVMLPEASPAREGIVRAAMLVMDGREEEGRELWEGIREQVRGTRDEVWGLVVLGDAVLVSSSNFESREMASEFFREAIDLGVFAPALPRAFFGWRSGTQIQFGHSNYSTLPNDQYNVRRDLVCHTITAHLRTYPEDVLARDLLAFTARYWNLRPDGAFGNSNIIEMRVWMPIPSEGFFGGLAEHFWIEEWLGPLDRFHPEPELAPQQETSTDDTVSVS